MMGGGTVNDEELVEVMDEALFRWHPWSEGAGERVLAALRSAGFKVVRSEEPT